MADRAGLTLAGVRDDGNGWVVEVDGSHCVVVVVRDEDGLESYVNVKDAVLSRGGWDEQAGPVPDDVADVVLTKTASSDWCTFEAF